MNTTFKEKSVLVTGHTGFKGSWLCAWLDSMGARVTGLALAPPTQPSHFEAAGLLDIVEDVRVDVRDAQAVADVIHRVQPDFVFHLAAQALVRRSYDDPLQTWQTNVMGTLHVLEALRKLERQCIAVIITSDKCYDNVEWVWGYRENDVLGGPDPYSASKGAAELAIKSHIKSYFHGDANKVRIASARAGNVIGGGDWASDRIIPDCVRAWSQGQDVQLRNPHSTRPWQHVMEPLGGYLALAAALEAQPALHGESFNFGPPAQQNHSVMHLVQEMAQHWSQVKWKQIPQSSHVPYESGLLKLNCDKALHLLNWHAVMGFEDTVRMTAEWYGAYYRDPSNIIQVTRSQIAEYCAMAKAKGAAWIQ